MLKGFRDFITRGNVVDLAVGVVIGAAFTAIITAFTQNLIDPLVSAIGGVNTDGLGFRIIPSNPATFLDFGAIITAIINFLIVAAVLYFAIVVPMNKYMDFRESLDKEEKKEEEPETPLELLTEIRDLLAARTTAEGATTVESADAPTLDPLARAEPRGAGNRGVLGRVFGRGRSDGWLRR